MSDIVILGAAGMLGYALRQQFPHAKYFDLKPNKEQGIQQIDIADKRSVASQLSELEKKTIVVNAAAYPKVDDAETAAGSQLSYEANVVGSRNLAEIISKKDLRCVHYSTSYVFHGLAGGYNEQSETKPMNVYGKHKLHGEKMMLGAESLILRTDCLYGPQGPKNIVDAMVRKALQDHFVPGVVDQIGCPTLTTTLARITAELIDRWEKGTIQGHQIFHTVSRGACTREQLAQKIMDILELPYPVEQMTTEQYNARYRKDKVTARRPEDCSLDTTKIERLGIFVPAWESDLEAYLNQHVRPTLLAASQTPAKTL